MEKKNGDCAVQAFAFFSHLKYRLGIVGIHLKSMTIPSNKRYDFQNIINKLSGVAGWFFFLSPQINCIYAIPSTYGRDKYWCRFLWACDSESILFSSDIWYDVNKQMHYSYNLGNSTRNDRHECALRSTGRWHMLNANAKWLRFPETLAFEQCLYGCTALWDNNPTIEFNVHLWHKIEQYHLMWKTWARRLPKKIFSL